MAIPKWKKKGKKMKKIGKMWIKLTQYRLILEEIQTNIGLALFT